MTSPRIVSLLPSATEILAVLGLGPYQVGRSHECDYPADRCRPYLTGNTKRGAHAAVGGVVKKRGCRENNHCTQ
jgi:ABC-type hemin transport system substrate-binding protein